MVCILLSYLLLFQARLVPASLVYFGCEKHKGDCFTHITISLVGIYMVYLVKKCALFNIESQCLTEANVYLIEHLFHFNWMAQGGGVAQWVTRLTRDQWIPVSREFESHQRPPVVSLSKKLYSHCLVLVGSRNGLERDLHKQIIACFKIKLK